MKLTQISLAINCAILFCSISVNATPLIPYHFKAVVPDTQFTWDFKDPWGIAVAADGTVWLADSAHNRLQHVNPDGSLISEFSVSMEGAENAIGSITLAEDGSFWVTRPTRQVIQHYGANSAFLQEIGLGSGTKGNGKAEFNNPSAIKIANDGSLWVSDSGNNRLQHLKADGTYLGEISNHACDALPKTIFPNGARTAPNGNVWVAGLDRNYQPALFMLKSGSVKLLPEALQPNPVDVIKEFLIGTGPGEFGRIINDGNWIDFAADGSVWVVDSFNSRVQHLSADGQFIAQSKGFESEANALYGIAVAKDGTLWLTDQQKARILHLTKDGILIEAIPSSQFVLDTPVHIAIAEDATIWLDNNYNRLLHLDAKGQFIERFATDQCQSGAGQLSNPSGFVIAQDGSLWVADTDNNRLQHFAANGNFLGQVGHIDPKIGVASSGSNPGEFKQPDDIVPARDGSLWVADSGNFRLQHLSAKGEFIASFSVGGDAAGNGKYSRLAHSPDGSLWLVDFNPKATDHSARIQHFSAEGQLIKAFGVGHGQGQFYAPQSLVVLKDQSLWVADTLNHRLQHLTADGRFIASVGSLGAANGQFNQPTSLAQAPDGTLWIADTQNRRLLHLQANGDYTGQIKLTAEPLGLAIAADGSLWFSNEDRKDIGAASGSSYSTLISHIKPDGSPINSFVIEPRYYSRGLQRVPLVIAPDKSIWLKGETKWYRYDASGMFLSSVMQNYSNMHYLPDGRVWVFDPKTSHMQLFSSDENQQFNPANLMSQIGIASTSTHSNELGQFNSPLCFATTGDDSLWVVDTGNHRLQKFSAKTLANYAVEYDDHYGLLFIDDALVNDLHFQGVMQAQHGRFRLLSMEKALNNYNPVASFNTAQNLLSIPLARAFGQDYQGLFKWLGDSIFTLESVTTK